MSWQAIRIIITSETLDTAVIQCAAVLRVDHELVRQILEKHTETFKCEDGDGYYYKFKIDNVDETVRELLYLK